MPALVQMAVIRASVTLVSDPTGVPGAWTYKCQTPALGFNESKASHETGLHLLMALAYILHRIGPFIHLDIRGHQRSED